MTSAVNPGGPGYADCLQEMHGQRPVIFYSNGSSHFCDEPVFDDADADATEVIKLIDRVNDIALVIRAA